MHLSVPTVGRSLYRSTATDENGQGDQDGEDQPRSEQRLMQKVVGGVAPTARIRAADTYYKVVTARGIYTSAIMARIGGLQVPIVKHYLYMTVFHF